MCGVIAALCYYGWPVIEAVLLLLPVPDPSDMKDKVKGWFGQTVDFVKSIPAMVSGDNGRAPVPGYQTEFASQGSLQDDDDDDEEDIGKNRSTSQNALDYDSDEKDDEAAEANQELISLDGGASNKRKKVPKLKKPGQ